MKKIEFNGVRFGDKYITDRKLAEKENISFKEYKGDTEAEAMVVGMLYMHNYWREQIAEIIQNIDRIGDCDMTDGYLVGGLSYEAELLEEIAQFIDEHPATTFSNDCGTKFLFKNGELYRE